MYFLCPSRTSIFLCSWSAKLDWRWSPGANWRRTVYSRYVATVPPPAPSPVTSSSRVKQIMFVRTAVPGTRYTVYYIIPGMRDIFYWENFWMYILVELRVWPIYIPGIYVKNKYKCEAQIDRKSALQANECGTGIPGVRVLDIKPSSFCPSTFSTPRVRADSLS